MHSSSPYQSPPFPPSDPYRASPIAVNPRQPYSTAFSPPPAPPNVNGFTQIPSGQSNRYAQYGQQQHRSGPNRFASPQPFSAASYPQVPQSLPPAQHKGTLAPGQIVKVGSASVRIERYLSEGGYAHVYLSTSDAPVYPPSKGEKRGRWGEKGYTQHCLKRIAFQDESVWTDVKREIEVMKSLPPNPHLTQYLGSAHSKLPNGGYEVFILMEFCSGGGIIDLLNKRLRDRLKEAEILNIFADVCEAVAAMHSLPKPLLHRDLKIENVLSQPTGLPPSAQRPTPLSFKLCDFGSTTFPASHPPASKIEADALALDLNKNTTLQYRSPEMVEPMLGLAVGLPSDVWALGVLLYKLCYYTTPFEEHGTLAIVNAKYTFPQYPVYSPRVQHLIASMLIEQPQRRPTVYEILQVAHEMSGTEPEVDYPAPSRPMMSIPPQGPTKPTPQSANLLDFTSPTSPTDLTPAMQPSLLPTVQPQRRGRPTREPSKQELPKPSMPPLPQPPLVSEASAGTAGAQSSRPRLQVTGEKAPATAAALSTYAAGSQPLTVANRDAFGVPSQTARPQKAMAGFGDSFAQFGPPPVANTNATLQQLSAGVGASSRAAKPPAVATVAPTKLSNAPQNRFAYSLPRNGSSSAIRKKSPGPASSIPDGQFHFETRFPSIETLSAGEDAASPPAVTDIALKPGSTKSPVNLISPITPSDSRPSMLSRPSMIGNLTGGDLASPKFSMTSKGLSQPQPRSTNVTGTAFRQSPNATPDKAMGGYFEAVSQTLQQVGVAPEPAGTAPSTAVDGQAPTPLDLMTGDEEPLQSTPDRSAEASASSATSTRRLPRLPDPNRLNATLGSASGHPGPVGLHIKTEVPSKINVDTEVRPDGAQTGNVTSPRTESSSDEEGGPEAAAGTGQRPSSTQRRASSLRTTASPVGINRSAFEPSGSNGVRQPSPDKQAKASSTPLPSEDSTRLPNRRLPPTERSRPQSMYAASPSNARSAINPSITNSLNLTPAAQRPQHVRKGSVTDAVSKYETSVISPVKASLERQPSASQPVVEQSNPKGPERRPPVTAKPAALRKPTFDQAKPPTTVEPQLSAKTAPKPATNPEVVSQPSRFGETSALTSRPAAYAKSSAGRSFPVVRPQPGPKPAPISTAQREGAAASPASKSPDTPEKQQSVNSLIARWNQGK